MKKTGSTHFCSSSSLVDWHCILTWLWNSSGRRGNSLEGTSPSRTNLSEEKLKPSLNYFNFSSFSTFCLLLCLNFPEGSSQRDLSIFPSISCGQIDMKWKHANVTQEDIKNALERRQEKQNYSEWKWLNYNNIGRQDLPSFVFQRKTNKGNTWCN